MTVSQRARLLGVALVAIVAAGTGCGSDDGASEPGAEMTEGPVAATAAVAETRVPTVVPATATPAVSSATAPTTTGAAATESTTSPTVAPSASTNDGALPTVDVQDVTLAQLDELLPDLAPATTAATYVVELRLRTLEVTIDGSALCLGGGDAGLQPDSCADVAEGRGVLVYADDAATRVYAVLTTDQVAVVFERLGGGLTCFSEPVSGIEPLVVWWCEDQFPPLIRFELASGPRYQVAVG